MAKKRRDKEHDSSTASKVAKVGVAALTIGVGAASFNKSALGRKIKTEILPSALKANKTIGKELRNSKATRSGLDKRTTAKDLKRAWEVGKQTFKDETNLRRSGSVKLNTHKKNNFLGAIKHFEQLKTSDISFQLKSNYRSELQAAEIAKLLSKEKYKNKNPHTIKNLALEAYSSIEENTLKNKDNKLGFSDFLSGRFKKAGFTQDEEYEFLTSIYNSNEAIKKRLEVSNPFLIETKNKISKEINNTLLESKKQSDTIYSKFDNFIKKIFDVDIDSEMSFANSKALTVKDFKEKIDSFNESDLTFQVRNSDGKLITRNFKDILNSMEGLADDTIIDKSIRIDANGNIFSTAESRELFNNMFRDFSSSTLGRLFGLTDLRLDNDKAAFATFKALSTGKEAGYELGNVANNTILMNSKVAIANPTTGKAKLFETTIDDFGNLVMSDAIAEGKLRENRHGKSARLVKEMVGTNKDILTANDSDWAQALDLQQSGAPSVFAKLKSKLNAKDNPEATNNILKRQKYFFSSELPTEEKILKASQVNLMNSGEELTTDALLQAQTQTANRVLKDQKEISSMLNGLTAFNQISDDSIASLIASGNINDSTALEMLNILNNKEYNNAEELLNMISQNGDIHLFNKDLENIVKKGLTNSDYIESMQNISQIGTSSIVGFSMNTTNVMDIEQVIKRETLKEVLLRESGGGVKDGIAHFEHIIQNSNLSQEQSKNLRYLGNWAIMQKNLELYNDMDAVVELNQLMGHNSPLKNFDDLFTTSGAFRDGYIGMIDDLGARTKVFEAAIGNINESYINEYNSYTFMKESALSRLSQVKNINDAIKTLGEAGRELGAGRHNLNDYTTLTQLPQFMVARLSWGVEALGLNLSQNSTGSTLDMIKNIGLKRILPVAGALALYDYMNYESENFTGVSITGAAANALANVDKASRRLAYSTGIGQAIDWWKESSVIGDYWTGSTDFQTVEEREEWYKNGYSAVRSGRMWGFGSTNEYRGGNIQYYQPNYLKRAHSNYHEVSLYGSAEEKFKHSWLPSLRHPLSPLRAMWDPYWLEKKNMDERPYPLTGKLFSEGTAWGAILNPTLGEMIKPVKMLPEVKRRLGSDGRDARNVLRALNDKIKAKGNKNDNALIFEGTDIRNAKYYSYGNPGDGYMNINIANGQASSKGIDFMDGVPKLHKSVVPTGEVIAGNSSYGSAYNEGGELIDPNSELIQEFSSISYDTKSAVNDIVGGINNAIKSLASKFGGYRSNQISYTPGIMPDRSQGTYVYTNLVNQMNQRNLKYYDDISTGDMIDKSLVNSYLKDGAHSIKQLSGIYNFLGELAFGEDSYTFQYANAGAMTSTSRRFWDANIGGFGGELMEIARRFFPSEDKSIIRYNPLRNSMPEWLPERFLTGDPFTSLPKGEMRMPGKGYETLNDLHPDEFGEYGAFDRFKILADIAPTSEEYKLWRNIARNTVTDPALIKEMEEIQSRANKQSGKHEFYDYRYYNNNVKMNKGVVKSINGSTVELVSGEKLNLGGIKLNQDADISQILNVGEHINYRTSANAIKRLEDGMITNAVIYKQDLGTNTNVNKTLVTMGMAEKDKDDRTAIGYLANASAGQQTLGALQEFIGHANIPFLHNKYMKIETARESFLNEQVYGSPFTTWDHPIKGFIRPAINNTSKQNMLQHAIGVGSAALFMNIDKLTDKTYMKYLAGGLMAATNPSALLGMGTAGVWNLGVKATKIGTKSNIELGAGIGATIGSIAWGWNNAENPLKAASSFAIAGENIAKYLKMDELGWSHGKGALIGAAIGLGISAIKNPGMSKNMFRTKWVPKETEKKFEIDEYFDRLEYIKYNALYKQASLRAFVFEGGSNVRAVFNRIDKNKEKIAKLKRKAEKLSNRYIAEGYEFNEKMQKINAKIEALESQQTVLRGGKYTEAAVAYKKAMESTIYGMSSGATQDEILGAVPDQYKDYFMNFMNETNIKERKKILKALPEYLRKPLQIAWNEKVDKVDSNNKFFKSHKLPGMAWRGWKPNVNLKHVKMKTIQNEGMLLSDFGYYESEKSKMQYHMAEGINDFDKGGLHYMSNMVTALSGLGVSLQNISVEPTSSPGLWIVGDIKQTASDVMKVGQYGIASGLSGLTSILF